MGYNFAGITIDKNFGKDPDQVVEFLGLPLVFEKEIDFELGSGYKEDGYFDIFFSDKGTSIYTDGSMETDPIQSKGCSILSYMVSETAMTFFMSLDKNGRRVRAVAEIEGDVSNIVGRPLAVEKNEDLMDAIIKQKEKMFGLNFYEMPLDFKGFRYKSANATGAHKAPFYDSDSLASNPGGMSFSIMQWIKMNFLAVLKMGIILFGSLVLAVKFHWLFAIVFLGALLYNIWYWFGVFNKFKAGDVNPGKVISINPDRVAVATNMTKFGANYPILKIIDTKLPRFEKEIGKYIPTIALYNDNPYGYPFWAEFHPVPMSHGTSDKRILKAKLETFSKEDFDKIDNFLNEINTIKKGTYKVAKDTSDWKKYPDVEVGSLRKMKAPKKNDESQ